jgi:type I restriction enzyme, S subunit
MFAQLPFPLPPLAEQRRIVIKIDELMSLCDRLEAARAEREATRNKLAAATLTRLNASDPDTFKDDARFALAVLPALTTRADQMKQLRQTILDLAVRGKLAPQHVRDEPPSELLERIAAHKAAVIDGRARNKAASIRPLADDSIPFDLPSNWVWAAFGDIVVSRDGERIPVSKEERSRRAKLFDYYGASGVIDKIDNYLFDKPLLLIGEDGANLVNRSTPIAFIARGKYWVNNHAHVLDGLSEEFLRYLALFINAIDLKPYVTGTAQPKMNQAKMNSIPVALPPLAEQSRILAKVDELMTLCDRLEASLATTDDTRRRLLQALLAEALSPALTIDREAAE